MHPRTPVLALAAAAVLLLTAGCNDTEPTAAHPHGGKQHGGKQHQGTGSTGSDPAPSSPDDSSDGGSTETTAVPVYYVGDSPQGPRLFREFRRVPADDPLGGAADLVTQGDPLDPDYRSLFPSGTFASVSYTSGAIHVEVADDAWTNPAPGMSSATAKLAIQQLVYTLQGVQQERVPVIVERDGSPATLFGMTSGSGFRNADWARTLSMVSVTSPEQDTTVADTFSASGVASSFEANVPWEIRQGDQVVKRGYATAEGWMDKLYPWQAEVDVSDLAPGHYTFVALTDDPSSGEGGGPQSDSKDITVS